MYTAHLSPISLPPFKALEAARLPQPCSSL